MQTESTNTIVTVSMLSLVAFGCHVVHVEQGKRRKRRIKVEISKQTQVSHFVLFCHHPRHIVLKLEIYYDNKSEREPDNRITKKNKRRWQSIEEFESNLVNIIFHALFYSRLSRDCRQAHTHTKRILKTSLNLGREREKTRKKRDKTNEQKGTIKVSFLAHTKLRMPQLIRDALEERKECTHIHTRTWSC